MISSPTNDATELLASDEAKDGDGEPWVEERDLPDVADAADDALLLPAIPPAESVTVPASPPSSSLEWVGDRTGTVLLLPKISASGTKLLEITTPRLFPTHDTPRADFVKESSFALLAALLRKAPAREVLAVLEACPEAAAATDNAERIPLHLACEKGAALEVVSALLAAHPAAVRTRDHWGSLSLHLAVQHGCSLEVVQALLAAWPGATRERDGQLRLPVHAACESDAAGDVVQTLVHALSEHARESELIVAGYRLRGAVTRAAPAAEVLALLAACPEAAAVRSLSGLLALHLACEKGAATAGYLEVIEALLLAWPESLHETVDCGLEHLLGVVETVVRRQRTARTADEYVALEAVIAALRLQVERGRHRSAELEGQLVEQAAAQASAAKVVEARERAWAQEREERNAREEQLQLAAATSDEAARMHHDACARHLRDVALLEGRLQAAAAAHEPCAGDKARMLRDSAALEADLRGEEAETTALRAELARVQREMAEQAARTAAAESQLAAEVARGGAGAVREVEVLKSQVSRLKAKCLELEGFLGPGVRQMLGILDTDRFCVEDHT